MTHRELEKLIGDAIPRRQSMILFDRRLFHQLEDGSWEEYPPYETAVAEDGERG